MAEGRREKVRGKILIIITNGGPFFSTYVPSSPCFYILF